MTSAIRAQREAKEDGFTLIELLVVVIIIGILAAIAIPAFLSQRERAFQAALTSDVRNAALEIEAQTTAGAGTIPTAPSGQPFEQSDPTTVMAYYVSDNSDEFCIVGTRADLGAAFVAYANAAGGLQDFDANDGGSPATGSDRCPAPTDVGEAWVEQDPDLTV